MEGRATADGHAYNYPSAVRLQVNENLGWGPSGPYTLAWAPMVHPNQTVTLAMTTGVPGFRDEAVAAAHPADDSTPSRANSAKAANKPNVTRVTPVLDFGWFESANNASKVPIDQGPNG